MTMLTFSNEYPTKVWVTIVFWSPDTCGQDGNWQTIGWYGIDPGSSSDVYDNDLEDLNRYWYFYAKAADGAQWSGDFGPIYVYHEAFNSCLGVGSSAAYATVGLREIDIDGYDDFTQPLG
jgi:uncharacterized membrane protein